MTSKPNLVVIQGETAIRYVEGVRDQIALIENSGNVEQLKRDIEYFRVHGIEHLEDEKVLD